MFFSFHRVEISWKIFTSILRTRRLYKLAPSVFRIGYWPDAPPCGFGNWNFHTAFALAVDENAKWESNQVIATVRDKFYANNFAHFFWCWGKIEIGSWYSKCWGNWPRSNIRYGILLIPNRCNVFRYISNFTFLF